MTYSGHNPDQMEQDEYLQWLTDRQSGIGGSDAAAALGMSPWKTRFELWQEKTSPISVTPPTIAMQLGNFLEPFLARWYADQTGYTVQIPREPIISEEHPFMRCNLDGIALKEKSARRIIQFKTSGSTNGWGEEGSSDIPMHYYVQCQHEMWVSGFEHCDVPVLFFDRGRHCRIYTIEAEPNVQAVIVEQEADFWRHVITKEPPPLHESDDVAARYPFHLPGKCVVADDEIMRLARKLEERKAELKNNEDEVKQLEQRLKMFIGEHEGLVDSANRLIATYKAGKRTTVDSKQLKAQQPETWEQFSKTSTFRTLRLKELSK